MTYEKKQAFEADSEKIEALQQPGQFPELVATDESLVALYNEQLVDGQSLTPLQAEDRAMDDETNWTTMRTFFRRAQRLVSERLTVIVSLVSTVLTDVFGHLHERLDGSTEDGIPAIPFGSTASPAVAETLGTLPAAVRLLRSRKITNGATDTAIPDGCSLGRLLCDGTLQAAVTELIDDNTGWIYSSANMIGTLCNVFPNVGKITLRCKQMTASIATSFSSSRQLELHIYDCTSLPTADTSFFDCYITDATQLYLYVHDLVEFYAPATDNTWCSAREVYLPSFAKGRWKIGFHRSYALEPTRKIYFGCKGGRNDLITLFSTTGTLTNLEDIVLGEGARQPFKIEISRADDWTTTIIATGMTRETIMDHIINRLADNRFEDDGVTPAPAITISLGSLEIAKLTAEDIAVATNKNYTLA